MAGIFPRERVNEYLFARQGLAEGHRAADCAAAAARCAGVRVLPGIAPHLSLMWRTETFEGHSLSRAVNAERSLVPIFGPEGGLRLVPPRPAAAMAAAGIGAAAEFMAQWGVSEIDYRLLSRAILRMLVPGGVTLADLWAGVPPAAGRQVFHRAQGPLPLLEVLLEALLRLGRVVRLTDLDGREQQSHLTDVGCRDAPAQYRYYRWEDVYGGTPPADLDPAAARRETATFYLAAFGPVSREDLAHWTGWSRRILTQAIQELMPELVEVGIGGLPGGFLVLAPDYRRLQRGVPLIAGLPTVCLLPGGDGYIDGYANALRFVSQPWQEGYARYHPTVLADGKVIGYWAQGEQDEAVVIRVWTFPGIEPPVYETLEAAARRTGEFIGQGTGQPVRVQIGSYTRPGA